MYVEKVFFEQGYLVTYEASKIHKYHLHCHEDVLEVLFVIKGSANIKVSFENFIMKEGDFIIINKEDSHSIYSQDSACYVVSIYFDIEKIAELEPYLRYIIFACESFDLVKYKGETYHLRKMLCELVKNIEGNTIEATNKLAIEFMRILSHKYDTRNYYSQDWDMEISKIEKYHEIIQYLHNNYQKRGLIEYIAEQMSYSKSHIYFIFKSVCGINFQDSLTYFRLYKSERMLLDSDETIENISASVGFSDIKYYTKNFRKWFGSNPSEYRRMYKTEVMCGSMYQALTIEETYSEVEKHLYVLENGEYRSAITPLNVEEKVQSENITRMIDQQNQKEDGLKENRVCIVIKSGVDLKKLLEVYTSITKRGVLCCFIIECSDMSALKLRELLIRCSDVFESPIYKNRNSESVVLEVVITYNLDRGRDIVNNAIKDLDQKARNLSIEAIRVMEI